MRLFAVALCRSAHQWWQLALSQGPLLTELHSLQSGRSSTFPHKQKHKCGFKSIQPIGVCHHYLMKQSTHTFGPELSGCQWGSTTRGFFNRPMVIWEDDTSDKVIPANALCPACRNIITYFHLVQSVWSIRDDQCAPTQLEAATV